MSQLRHTNVCLYLGACLEPPCLVMEYAARKSVDTLLSQGRKDPRVSRGAACSVVWQYKSGGRVCVCSVWWCVAVQKGRACVCVYRVVVSPESQRAAPLLRCILPLTAPPPPLLHRLAPP